MEQKTVDTDTTLAGSAAGGSLSGTFPNPTIAAQAVTNTMISGIASNCSNGQVLKADGSGGFSCAADAGAGGADATSLRGESLDPSLATNTTTDGQILVWSQTNSRWEVGNKTIDTDTNAGTQCSAGQYLDGDGTCKAIPVDTTIPNTNAQTICTGATFLDGDGNCTAMTVDTTIPDTNAQTLCGTGQLLDGDGNCIAIPVDTTIPNTNASTICTGTNVLNGSGACVPLTTDTDTNAGTQCSAGQYLDGDGTCKAIPVDTTIPNTNAQTLCGSGQLLDGDGNCIAIPVDTTIPNTNAATICTGTQILNGSGACVALPVDTTIPDTNAGTQCSAGQYLDGDGTCKAIPVDTTIPNTNAATICTGTNVLNGSGACVPMTTDTNTNAQTQCTGTQVLNGSGACVALPVDTTIPDTNAGTQCSAGQYLDGDGTCKAVPSGADDMGNHTATSNIVLGSNYLSGDGGNEGIIVNSAGRVGIGTGSVNTSAQLDISSTTKGLLPPRMTEVQRDAIATPAAGLVVYNNDSNALNVYDGTDWVALGSGGGGGGGSEPDEIVFGLHTEADCIADGGERVNIGGIAHVCRFAGSSCAAGWTQFENWNTTSSNSGSGSGCSPGSCSSSSQAWGNHAPATCGYATGKTYSCGCDEYGCYTCCGGSTGIVTSSVHSDWLLLISLEILFPIN